MWRFNIYETYLIIRGMHLTPLVRYPWKVPLIVVLGLVGIIIKPDASLMGVILLDLHKAITIPTSFESQVKSTYGIDFSSPLEWLGCSPITF